MSNAASWISWAGVALVWFLAGFNIWMTRHHRRLRREALAEAKRAAKEACDLHAKLTNAEREIKERYVFAGYVVDVLAWEGDAEHKLAALQAAAQQRGLMKPEVLQ